ncbi:hypothetical protein V1477_005098 [Vespula maculifrons]|uniref:Uncharacterized protein n=1 Tax=Vespula maculifrons TaxID=7453 RepID=A0ABD2CNP3_VESMC
MPPGDNINCYALLQASSIPLSYLHEEQKGIRSIFVLTSHAFPRKAHFPSLKINGMMRRAWWSIRA